MLGGRTSVVTAAIYLERLDGEWRRVNLPVHNRGNDDKRTTSPSLLMVKRRCSGPKFIQLMHVLGGSLGIQSKVSSDLG
jgi:hypothetical protein